jgi:hypothetical protein
MARIPPQTFGKNMPSLVGMLSMQTKQNDESAISK